MSINIFLSDRKFPYVISKEFYYITELLLVI